MNDLIKQILSNTKESIEKAYKLADECINAAAIVISDNIVYDNQNDVFVVKHHDIENVVTTINVDKHGVVARVNENNNVVAICKLGINGSYEESMTRMTTLGLKETVAKYFDVVSGINIEAVLTASDADEVPTLDDIVDENEIKEDVEND